MERDGAWGDHLTLVSLCEHFGVPIQIISSIDSDQFIIETHPTIRHMNGSLLLSHWSERHFGSLFHSNEPLEKGAIFCWTLLIFLFLID